MYNTTTSATRTITKRNVQSNNNNGDKKIDHIQNFRIFNISFCHVVDFHTDFFIYWIKFHFEYFFFSCAGCYIFQNIVCRAGFSF